MKAIDFLTTTTSRETAYSAYAILTNEPDAPVTPATFGGSVEIMFGVIPAGGVVAVYLADPEGTDLANALFRQFNASPDAVLNVDGRAVGLYELQ